MGKSIGSITVGATRVGRNSVIGFRPSSGVDTNTKAVVREVRKDLGAVRVDAYRNGKLLARDSGWYRIGTGLYQNPRTGSAYVVGNGKGGYVAPPAKRR